MVLLLLKKLIFLAAFYSFFVVFWVWKIVLSAVDSYKALSRAKVCELLVMVLNAHHANGSACSYVMKMMLIARDW